MGSPQYLHRLFLLHLFPAIFHIKELFSFMQKKFITKVAHEHFENMSNPHKIAKK